MSIQAIHKISVSVRHGFTQSWSYRANFFGKLAANLFNVFTYFFLEKLFTEVGLNVVKGESYFTFLLIGGTLNIYLSQAMQVFSNNLNDELPKGTIEPLLVTATHPALVLLGPSAWILIEVTITAFAKLGLGILLGANFSQANWLSVTVIMLLSFASVICYGIFSASFTLVFKRADPISFTMRTLSSVFSGVYFPVTIFPPVLRAVSYLLPFTFAIRGLRGALMQGKTIIELSNDVLALSAFTVILVPLSLACLHYAIRYTKRTGNLGHY